MWIIMGLQCYIYAPSALLCMCFKRNATSCALGRNVARSSQQSCPNPPNTSALGRCTEQLSSCHNSTCCPTYGVVESWCMHISTQPKDHMSTAWSYLPLVNISGAVKRGVPTPADMLVLRACQRLVPKSPIFGCRLVP